MSCSFCFIPSHLAARNRADHGEENTKSFSGKGTDQSRINVFDELIIELDIQIDI